MGLLCGLPHREVYLEQSREVLIEEYSPLWLLKEGIDLFASPPANKD